MSETRSQKSIKNATVSFIFLFINLALSFISRPIFLEGLGDELLGVRTTVANLLGTLGLAELGIVSVIGYALYKPLHDKDVTTINEILTVQAWFYRKVTWVVCICSVGILLFFPYFFRDTDIPLWAAYATYGVLLWQVVMSYLINYRSIIFGADQRGYKLSMNTQGVMITKVILQMAIVKWLPNPYPYYLAIEFIVSLIGIYILERMIQKYYPWLKVNTAEGRQLLRKHTDLVKKTGQMFAHKIGGTVLANITPLIMLNFSSLVMITHYENYMTITRNTGAVLGAVVGSIAAGIGSLVAEGNLKKTLRFFWEYNALVHFFSVIICFGVYAFADNFIVLWIGEQYIIEEWVLGLIVINLYITLTRQTRDNFINAKGLFGDIGAPIVESILTVGLSSLLGYYWGLPGVLLGVILALFAVVVCWKSYYLFSSGFELSIWNYWGNYAKYLILSFIFVYGGGEICIGYLPKAQNYYELIISALICTTLFSLIWGGTLFITSEGARLVTSRFKGIIIRKLRGEAI